MKTLNFLEKILSFIKSLFLNGLFTLLPITATIFFVHFTYTLLARWLEPLKKMEPLILQKIPGAEIIIVTIFILLIGIIVKLFVITPLVHKFERIISRIPLIRSVYSSVKKLVEFFYLSKTTAVNKKVVLIQYPKKGSYNIAFLLDSAESTFQKVLPKSEQESGKKFYKVFMPNSPNPTSGYFFILSEDEITHTNISFEEAIKTVVSCGLITPDSLLKMP